MLESQLRDVKATFSTVVDRAEGGHATVVTKHGRPAAVVLGYNEWQRLTAAKPSFAELLLSFPDVGDLKRDPTPARDILA